MTEQDMDMVGDLILRALAAHDNDSALADIKREVETMCARFPLYRDR
jgi:glycine/serine hydroxymethyltransferase